MFHDLVILNGLVCLYAWSGHRGDEGECVRRGFIHPSKISHVHCDWDSSLIRIFAVNGESPAFTVSYAKYDDAGEAMATAIDNLDEMLRDVCGGSSRHVEVNE